MDSWTNSARSGVEHKRRLQLDSVQHIVELRSIRKPGFEHHILISMFDTIHEVLERKYLRLQRQGYWVPCFHVHHIRPDNRSNPVNSSSNRKIHRCSLQIYLVHFVSQEGLGLFAFYIQNGPSTGSKELLVPPGVGGIANPHELQHTTSGNTRGEGSASLNRINVLSISSW